MIDLVMSLGGNMTQHWAYHIYLISTFLIRFAISQYSSAYESEWSFFLEIVQLEKFSKLDSLTLEHF